MLDRLLGRASLKERIGELEEENERLRNKLEAESERRREAVAARNEAEEELNRLEDRVTELEDRVERAETGEETLDFRGTADVRGERLREICSRLDSVETDEEGALSAMVVDEHDVPERVRDAFGDRTPLVERAVPSLVYTDDEGLVSAALVPPVAPDDFVTWDDGFRVDEEWFLPEAQGRFALVLVRADLCAVGVYEGRERQAFEGFESDVKGKHSKGGFSQSRFERRRESQITEHVEKCHDALADLDVERLFVVGQRTLLDEFEDAADATAAVDATGDPEDALGDAFEKFWTARLRLL
ncbi:Vms1/Ankzf1 family peptidyl-tRNA hydrolase [Halospeciosus flavus]|uniref:Vms1/Ankzf1 family peptidyl-tRNA hydrolase n=1 Tax=Halospeciosus flavus TaxID=3032283 RepID=A0ABD5Z8P9_9EURY|nr:Vms1/Ankzf1 family peptidyl-tRNA hydrolase [Halospeciosus flavus]